MERDEFMYRLMAMMQREEDERKPVKHYGFGLPKHYRVIDAETGHTVTAVEHKDVAQTIACEQAEMIGHRFETCAMWL